MLCSRVTYYNYSQSNQYVFVYGINQFVLLEGNLFVLLAEEPVVAVFFVVNKINRVVLLQGNLFAFLAGRL